MTDMDRAQRQLFGEFPRAVGSPNQHIVHSEREFDVFAETVNGRRNAYSSISWFPGDSVVCDKVSFDLDSAEKDAAFPDGIRDDEKVVQMRSDTRVADEVLGEVCADARTVAERAEKQSVPLLAVFSGFGLHIHLLYQPESDPGRRMGSVARKWRDELKLTTLDHKVIGDAQRILRVPNMKRVHLTDLFDPNAKRYDCGLWTVPVTRAELAAVTPEWLLEQSVTPRPEVRADDEERPSMPFYPDYAESDRTHAITNRPDRESVEGELDEEGFHYIAKQLLQMPCVYENLLLDPEPPHEIRLNAAVLLFNLGMDPSEVLGFFERVGWQDWDRQVTARQLNHIYQKGYSDMSCETLQSKGYCTRSENPVKCRTYGWSGGEAEWK